MTGIMSDWVMSMIEDNLATPREPILVFTWRESSIMINVQQARKKSHFEHRNGNNSNLCENVACAQPI